MSERHTGVLRQWERLGVGGVGYILSVVMVGEDFFYSKFIPLVDRTSVTNYFRVNKEERGENEYSTIQNVPFSTRVTRSWNRKDTEVKK